MSGDRSRMSYSSAAAIACRRGSCLDLLADPWGPSLRPATMRLPRRLARCLSWWPAGQYPQTARTFQKNPRLDMCGDRLFPHLRERCRARYPVTAQAAS